MGEVRIRDKVDALVMLKHIIAYRDEYDAKLARREDGVRAGIHFRDAVFTLLHGISSDDVAAPSGMAEPVETFNPAIGSPATADQMAAVMLLHGNEHQQLQAMNYAAPPASDLRAALERIREKAKLGMCHGLTADATCEEIAAIASAALNREAK